jgi:hypothetical protein
MPALSQDRLQLWTQACTARRIVPGRIRLRVSGAVRFGPSTRQTRHCGVAAKTLCIGWLVSPDQDIARHNLRSRACATSASRSKLQFHCPMREEDLFDFEYLATSYRELAP